MQDKPAPDGAKHTEGRLHLFTLYADIEIRGPEESGVLVAVMSPWGTHADAPDPQRANARRLVACWNACLDVPIEVLEAQSAGGLPWSVADQIEQRRALTIAATDRADLLDDLRTAAATLRRYEGLHRAKGTAESTEKAEVNAALAARFEATLAKAGGGAA